MTKVLHFYLRAPVFTKRLGTKLNKTSYKIVEISGIVPEIWEKLSRFSRLTSDHTSTFFVFS